MHIALVHNDEVPICM